MTAAELRALAFRFRESRAVFAGVELGVFEALGDGARSANELAAELGLDARALGILLEALAALEVLVDDGGRYAIASELRATLVPHGASYAGNLFLHDLWHWTSWARLDQSIRAGSARQRGDGDAHLGDPEILGRFLPNYVLAMEQSEGGASEALARRIAALAPKRVLDLGGGSGGLLLRVLEREPSACGTLVDHVFSLSRARERASRSPARERMELLGLDFEKRQIPREHDVIVLSRVLMGMTPERARALVERAAEALPEGGVLIVHEFDAQTRVGALLSLDMLLHTGGAAHPRAQLEGWLAESGLELESARRVLPYTRAWIARRNG
ncbi:MAG: methyltransferase [Myxococcota bacterium]